MDDQEASLGGAAFNASGALPGMDQDSPFQVERLLAVVESCLCEMFPADFYRRCAFAAFGMRALLVEQGVDAVMVGGQFAALVMAPDGSHMAIQGFDRGPEPFPHFWIEAGSRLIDLGPYLLPFGSEYPVAPMPALAWDMSAPLPAALRYKTHQTLRANSRISANPAVRLQCDAFLARCHALAADPERTPTLPNWIATGPVSLAAAAHRKDPWASGVQRFERIAHSYPLPF